MKAKERVFQGDMLVLTNDSKSLRRMTIEDAGNWIGPNPWDYSYDKIKIEGIASATYEAGEDIVLYDPNNLPVFNMQKI